MTAWLADAACRDEPDPDVFFPDIRDNPQPALAWCADCPVQTECLATALADPHTVGVWGGRIFGARNYGTNICRNGHHRPAGTRCRDCRDQQRGREQQQQRRRRMTVTL